MTAPSGPHDNLERLTIFPLFGCAVLLLGSQLPDQGLNPGGRQRKHAVLTTGPPGSSLEGPNLKEDIALVQPQRREGGHPAGLV